MFCITQLILPHRVKPARVAECGQPNVENLIICWLEVDLRPTGNGKGVLYGMDSCRESQVKERERDREELHVLPQRALFKKDYSRVSLDVMARTQIGLNNVFILMLHTKRCVNHEALFVTHLFEEGDCLCLCAVSIIACQHILECPSPMLSKILWHIPR